MQMKKAARQESTLTEWVKAIVISAALVITFRGVVAQAYQTPSGSMENLFLNKMVNGSEFNIGMGGHPLSYYRFPAFRKPQRGDIIVFRYPENPSSRDGEHHMVRFGRMFQSIA